MNEADTRAEKIDPQLKDAGWGVVKGSKIRREYFTNEDSPFKSKKDKKKLKSIIQELNDMVPSKKIELVKTIYPKGWTTNPEYLD